MLREALASVVAGRPDEVILIDDGSDCFDVQRVYVEEFVAPANRDKLGITFSIVAAPPMSIDERMTIPRHGRLINEACALATGDILADLCDDDLHDAGWYDCLRAAWAREPGLALVRGDWLVFADGDAPARDDPPCPLEVRGMTAGNFAWHTSLTGERGAQWPTNVTSCHDNGFLASLERSGVDVFRVPCVGFAGWRREHEYVNVRHTNGFQHTPSFRALLERGRMEA
jgi:hypothetical protein